MSYSTKYIAEWCSYTGDFSGEVLIQKKDYIGDPIPLILRDEGIELNNRFKDWFRPTWEQNCNLTFLNDASNFYAYIDLFELDEREFKVIIDASDGFGNNNRLFEGFIDAGNAEQRYVTKTDFNLTASNYVSKLNDTHPEILDRVGKTSLLNVINDSLALTGKDASIRINCDLVPTSGLRNTQSTFSVVGAFTEAFWDDNFYRNSGFKSLNKVLGPLDCFVYWSDDIWYIERYNDIYDQPGEDKAFLEFSTAEDFTFESDGSVVFETLPIVNLCADTKMTGSDQVLGTIEGLKTLQITTKSAEFLNLTNNDFTGWNDISAGYPHGDYRDPSVRKWSKSDFLFHKSILGNVGSWKYNTFTITPNNQINNACSMKLNNYTNSDELSGSPEYIENEGIFTTFVTSVDPLNFENTLNIRWKWSPFIDEDAKEYYNSLDNFNEYLLPYYIKVLDASDYGFLVHDETNDIWELKQLSPTNPLVHDALNFVKVTPDQLDQETGVYEVSIQIPLHDVSSDIVEPIDRKYTLNIGYHQFWAQRIVGGHNLFARWWGRNQIVGDVVIASEVKEISGSNTLVAELDKDAINTKNVKLELFDTPNVNYRSGLYFGPNDFDTRTSSWFNRDPDSNIEWDSFIRSVESFGSKIYYDTWIDSFNGEYRNIPDPSNNHMSFFYRPDFNNSINDPPTDDITIYLNMILTGSLSGKLDPSAGYGLTNTVSYKVTDEIDATDPSTFEAGWTQIMQIDISTATGPAPSPIIDMDILDTSITIDPSSFDNNGGLFIRVDYDPSIYNDPVGSWNPGMNFNATITDIVLPDDSSGIVNENRNRIDLDLAQIQAGQYNSITRKNAQYDNTVGYRSDFIGYDVAEDTSTRNLSLVEWLIHDKFRLFNRNRRTIKANIIYPKFLKPFQIFNDDQIDDGIKYVLGSHTFYPQNDSFDIDLLEYDNTETMSLFEVNPSNGVYEGNQGITRVPEF